MARKGGRIAKVASTRSAAATPSTGIGTARQRHVAKLLAGGLDVENAMLEAGYGAGVIEGLAQQLPRILESLGLDTSPAAKAAPATRQAGGNKNTAPADEAQAGAQDSEKE